MLKGHGGNLDEMAARFKVPADSIIDFSSNVNTPIPPAKFRQWAGEAAAYSKNYPDPEYAGLRKIIAEKYSLKKENVLPGSGSTELLYLVPRTFRFKKALVASPSYADYADACLFAGTKVNHFQLKEKDGAFVLDIKKLSKLAAGHDLIILGNPNNPTGGMVERRELLKTVKENTQTMFLVDEAFIDFAPSGSLLGFAGLGGHGNMKKNLIVLRSLTKFYGIPGLRAGFAASHKEVIGKIMSVKEPWTINCFAQYFINKIFSHPLDEKNEVVKNEKERQYLYEKLSAIPGLHAYPSFANFMLIKINKRALTAKKLREKLMRKRFLIRDCSNFNGLDKNFFRIAVKKRSENRKLVDAIAGILKQP